MQNRRKNVELSFSAWFELAKDATFPRQLAFWTVCSFTILVMIKLDLKCLGVETVKCESVAES
jgi:hypothetical protein